MRQVRPRILAMRATPAMNTNADHGNWEYAGAYKINASPDRISRRVRRSNRKHSSIRARVEHVFRVIKRQFGFTRTRYCGLMKNAVQVNMLMGLANLYLLRRQLITA
ncbi:transposase [Nitrosomonas sp. Is35]|uniref:transposase n=1 Tax=Nitrosomonas sp. Is35 TaxID=3080534 RepID=UPI00294B25CE|nr:transposase [Nitrosomonas sp. Is35]MDV6346451.1 transposase [Nitrosomonas sp. Is35]